jgi:hypothetical protein
MHSKAKGLAPCSSGVSHLRSQTRCPYRPRHKRGTGLSDRVTGMPSLETRMDDVRTVLETVGSTHLRRECGGRAPRHPRAGWPPRGRMRGDGPEA